MNSSSFSSILMLVLIFVIFYLFLIRPENKRKKKLEEMRNSLQIGDEIVTIGGMTGRVVQVTEDTVTFETGEDRVRIQVKKWAISTNGKEEQESKSKKQTSKAIKGDETEKVESATEKVENSTQIDASEEDSAKEEKINQAPDDDAFEAK